MANEQFNHKKWCLDALVDLGRRYGHEKMRLVAKEVMKNRGGKSLEDFGSSEYLPIFNEVKSSLSEGGKS